MARVLIVGASRGLGLALVEEFARRGAEVIGTERSPSPKLAVIAARSSGHVSIERADTSDLQSLRELRERLDGQHLDIVIVNAGIALAKEAGPLTVADGDLTAMILTNALGPVRALELLEDLVGADGVLAVMSSEVASITLNTGFWQMYSASKSALNSLMKSFSSKRADDSRAMLLLAPGFVRTDMGGPGAHFSIEESIPYVADVVEQHRGVAGLKFVDRFGKSLPW